MPAQFVLAIYPMHHSFKLKKSSNVTFSSRVPVPYFDNTTQMSI